MTARYYTRYSQAYRRWEVVDSAKYASRHYVVARKYQQAEAQAEADRLNKREQ